MLDVTKCADEGRWGQHRGREEGQCDQGRALIRYLQQCVSSCLPPVDEDESLKEGMSGRGMGKCLV